MLFIMSDPVKILNMILHIDDGSMGGGGPSPHKPSTSWDDLEDDYFGMNSDYDKYFSKERVGIFHYCVFAHDYADNPDCFLHDKP